MQAAAQALRDSLWAKLETIYNQFSEGKDEIPISKVEEILEKVLGEVTKPEKDYVLKNLFRLDVDGSGTVSFTELGNFLFKKHCGEMSLQREHLAKKMKNGADRKMDSEQFHNLLNKAYSFLKVEAPANVTNDIFIHTDKDEDKLITYVEYFQVIEKYVLRPANYTVPKSQEKPKQQKPIGPERHSKLRKHIWDSLRKLYELYVHGRNLDASDQQIRGLILSIVGDLSAAELSFLGNGFLKLKFTKLTFVEFATHFLYLLAELGLSRYSASHPSAKKTLNRDQFVVLLKNTFAFAGLGHFKVSILYKIFDKIDKNHDGLISFDEYLDWVKRFLAVEHYYGDQFYVPEDDEDLDSSSPFDKPIEIKPKIDNTFSVNFSDYTLAKTVRQAVLNALIPYDVNKDLKFDETQIKKALVGLLKEDETELKYVTKNVFRYDKDGDQNVTYIELTDFSVEQHFGEMAIQRLHKKKYYSKGADRIMNESQFAATLNDALHYISIEATPQQIHTLFSELDQDQDGWISYYVYFMFLKYYFGTKSAIYPYPFDKSGNYITDDKYQKPISDLEKFLQNYKDLDAFERFKRIIRDQSLSIFLRYDLNKNNVFEADQIEAILEHVFHFDHSEIQFIMSIYFTQLVVKGGLTPEELISIILTIYFTIIIFKRKYKSNDSALWNQQKIDEATFISLITDNSYFLQFKVPLEDLSTIFKALDTDHDGFITYKQYYDFISKYLGLGLDLDAYKKKDTQVNPNDISPEEDAFLTKIWDRLKQHFDNYDTGSKKYLNADDLKRFLKDQLNETSQRELDYVFWNLFRVDPDSNLQIQFNEFAPFILSHAGEISLQRFQKEQVKGKRFMNPDEFQKVVYNGYGFLVSLAECKAASPFIYKRIAKAEGAGYGDFFQWVHNNLTKHYKK